jgi:RNA polymerase sigma factor (sigma-70 family)
MAGDQQPGKRPFNRRPYMMAVVLGAALSAIGSAQADSAIPERTINDIARYCTTCWRNARIDPNQWGDCTHDVFCRLLERFPADHWTAVLGAEGEERREFLRAIDAVKKKTQRGRRWVHGFTDDLADRHENQERDLADMRMAVRQASKELSDRQQRIIDLSFDGWSVAEIGAKLEMPVERVSDEKYKAIRKLRVALSA